MVDADKRAAGARAKGKAVIRVWDPQRGALDPGRPDGGVGTSLASDPGPAARLAPADDSRDPRFPVLAPPSPAAPLGPLRGAYAPGGPPPGVPRPPHLAGVPAVWPLASAPGAGASVPAAEISSLGLTAAQAAALSYSAWWLSGLVVYFSEHQSRFVRFHAFQSIVYTGMLTIVSVLGFVLSSLLTDAFLATHQRAYQSLAIGVSLIVFLAVIGAWITPLLAALSGRRFRIPIIAAYAERYAAPVAPEIDPRPGR